MDDLLRRLNSGVSPPKRNELAETTGGCEGKNVGGDQTPETASPKPALKEEEGVVLRGVKAKEGEDEDAFPPLMGFRGVKDKSGELSLVTAASLAPAPAADGGEDKLVAPTAASVAAAAVAGSGRDNGVEGKAGGRALPNSGESELRATAEGPEGDSGIV